MNADVHGLAGAYSLNALPPEEAVAFRHHLAECPACRQEVEELQATAAELGSAVTELPPEELRNRVLQAVHQTRKMPSGGGTGTLARQGRRSWPRWLAAAAAFVIIGGSGLGAVLSVLDDRPDITRQNQAAVVMNAPDARSASARLRGGGSMTVVMSRRLGKAVVMHRGLPELPPSRIYQLWLLDRQGNARSADVLIDSKPTDRRFKVIRRVRPGDRVAITREPAGGSEQPTSAPLAVVSRA